MTTPTDRLRHVLELEAARGYTNTAVVGGLDGMLRALLRDGALAPGTPAHEALLTLPARGYAALPVEARARWAQGVLRRLGGGRPSPRPAPAERERPAPPTALPPGGRGAGSARAAAPPSRLPSKPGEAGTARVSMPPARPPTPAVRTPPLRRPDAPLSLAARGGRAVAVAPPVAGPRRAAPPPRRPARPHPDGLDAPVTALPHVSTATAARLAKLEIRTVRDLLRHLPHRYEDFSRVRPVGELRPGEEQTVVATVWSAAEVTVGRTRKATEAIVGDHTGNLRVIWFNQPWLARQLPTNARVALSGKVTVFHGVRQMESPEWELLDGDLSEAVHTGRLLPVYPLTAGLAARTLRRLIREALDLYVPLPTAAAAVPPDPLPAAVRAAHGLLPLASALRGIHYPETVEQAGAARERLAFDELLTLQLAVLRRRAERRASAAAPVLVLPEATRRAFHASLPFALTAAQHRVTAAVLSDLARPTPMARLIQGDVGSGKTVVAAAALLAAVVSGRQAALMAPTEILAEQHFRTLCRLFGGDADAGPLCRCTPPYLDRPLRIGLLRGGLGPRARAATQRALAEGAVDIAVGTHALIQADVRLPRLGLAVVDEQHRFGVAQRAALRGDGDMHLLVMTATPIPRTLALTLYGDLDVSVIDEMPPGRRPVKTLVVQSHERDAAYTFIIEQLRAGRQAFVICPLVEESDKETMAEVKAATAEYERLRAVFTSASLALLHGRMSAARKDEVMREFRDRLHDVLVSTAVVEVGIDVPNATVIMVEGADRFGLAQLHQFRGRVGRGEHQSYCFLMADGVSEEARQRLQLMEEITDGFRLAEEDLRLRGPGEYFGTRQSGLPELKVAGLADTRLLERARAVAEAALAAGPDLAAGPFAGFAPAVERLLRGAGAEIS
jgi:ATP-dependent DNA helicase RecG